MKGSNVPQPAQRKGGASTRHGASIAATAALAGLVAACNPTVKVEAPDKPIVINLNVKIEQEVRVKVDKDVENLVQSNPALF
ncbi:YnbE-like lipoprotein [Dongia mobilis]|uniref:YnbE-like lipoprotein n=1 Tax=Dongia mobilis TaxID=578943 RepID=A0A4R6WU66_9PROT|nr:YnbE family lipoprotein [Dongia mobilis]TDQ83929.1 YnbE-like lipoprotein [Dongia mobilis]